MINYRKILTTNFSDKGWSIEGNSYEGISWSDPSPKPTKEEFDSQWIAIETEYAAKQYQRDRATKYPSITDYIDGVVKGDQAQIDAYITACLAVKAMYPKPQE